MIGSTKYGVNSYLTPIEADQQRYDKNFSILKAMSAIDDLNNDFLLPEIEQKPI